MTTGEQIEFVRDLSQNVVAELCQDIAQGKTPANWDGFELRALLVERFNRASFAMDRKRKREYNNAVLVNNL